MLSDLLIYNWKKNRRIIIVFACFLTIVAFIIPFQNFINDGPKIIQYYNYNQTNKVDFTSESILNPSIYNLTLKDYNDEYAIGMSVRYTQHYAMLPYVTFKNLNITSYASFTNNISKIVSKEISIVGLSKEQFNHLADMHVISSTGKFDESNNFITPKLLDLLNQSISNNLELSINNNFTLNSLQTFNWTLNSFINGNSGSIVINGESINLNHENTIIIPIEKLIQNYYGKIKGIDYYIGVNREIVYSLDSFLNFNPYGYQRFNYDNYFNLIHSEGSSIRPVTEYFFEQYSYSSSSTLNLISFVFLSIPSIIILYGIASTLVNQWEKNFLQSWLFFKPKGLSYSDFMNSYLLLGLLIALISSIVNFIIYKAVRSISFGILFNYSNFDLANNFTDIIVPNFILLSIICVLALRSTLIKLENKNWKEIQNQSFSVNDQTKFKQVFWIGLVAIVIGIILKLIPEISDLIGDSVTIQFWLDLVKLIAYVFAPILLIVGSAGYISKKYDLIEKHFLRLFPSIKLPNLKALHISESKKMGFLFILMFSFQFFLFIYSYNNIYYTNQRLINQVGSDYSVTFNGNFTSSEIQDFNTDVINSGLINSSLISYKFDSLGYSNITDNAFEVFQLGNDNKLPKQYAISSNERLILEKAIDEQKGIILSNGVGFNKPEIFLTMKNTTLKINLLVESIQLPGFTSNLKTILLFLPSDINTTILKSQKSERIFYFGLNGPKEDDLTKIREIARNYYDFSQNRYIDIDYGGYYTDGLSSSTINESVLFNITLVFLTTISLIGYIFLISVSLNSKKKSFGILLSKGLSKNKLKNSLIVDNFFLIILSICISMLISYLAVFDLLIIAFPGTKINFPIIQPEAFLVMLSLILILMLLTYTILSLIVKKRNIIDFLSIKNE